MLSGYFCGSKIWAELTPLDQSFVQLFVRVPEFLRYFFGSQVRAKVTKLKKTYPTDKV